MAQAGVPRAVVASTASLHRLYGKSLPLVLQSAAPGEEASARDWGTLLSSLLCMRALLPTESELDGHWCAARRSARLLQGQVRSWVDCAHVSRRSQATLRMTPSGCSCWEHVLESLT